MGENIVLFWSEFHNRAFIMSIGTLKSACKMVILPQIF